VGDRVGAAIGSLAGLSQTQLLNALRQLDSSDVAKLKKTCAEILSSPSSESAETIAVCQVVGSI
jgi:hypothetical protein